MGHGIFLARLSWQYFIIMWASSQSLDMESKDDPLVHDGRCFMMILLFRSWMVISSVLLTACSQGAGPSSAKSPPQHPTVGQNARACESDGHLLRCQHVPTMLNKYLHKSLLPCLPYHSGLQWYMWPCLLKTIWDVHHNAMHLQTLCSHITLGHAISILLSMLPSATDSHSFLTLAASAEANAGHTLQTIHVYHLSILFLVSDYYTSMKDSADSTEFHDERYILALQIPFASASMVPHGISTLTRPSPPKLPAEKEPFTTKVGRQGAWHGRWSHIQDVCI